MFEAERALKQMLAAAIRPKKTHLLKFFVENSLIYFGMART